MSKGQRSSSPHDEIRANIQFCIHSFILMWQVGTFVNQINLLGTVKVFWKFEVQRSKYMVTTWPNMVKLQFWSHNFIQMFMIGSFLNEKDLLGQCWAFLKIEDLRLKAKFATWRNMGKITVTQRWKDKGWMSDDVNNEIWFVTAFMETSLTMLFFQSWKFYLRMFCLMQAPLSKWHLPLIFDVRETYCLHSHTTAQGAITLQVTKFHWRYNLCCHKSIFRTPYASNHIYWYIHVQWDKQIVVLNFHLWKN